ncbi:hypothetical protein J3A83DRAFT_4083727, partial [Scleroderma citrinum]
EQQFQHHSHLTSNQDDSNFNYSTELYVPSWNMFHNADKEGHVSKEMLLGEILEGKTMEVVREILARRCWVLLCWLLTTPVPY